MERGELDGRCGGQLTVIKSTRPHWLTERKIAVPVLIAQKRSPEFPDTPTVMEFVKDEPTRQQLDLVMLTQGLDRPVMLPPGVPAERVRELRAAFDATMADSAFRASIQSLFGGNITLYTSLCERARADAYDLMIQHAQEMGANAILAMRYDANEIPAGITEVLAYGTAVVTAPTPE